MNTIHPESAASKLYQDNRIHDHQFQTGLLQLSLLRYSELNISKASQSAKLSHTCCTAAA